MQLPTRFTLNYFFGALRATTGCFASLACLNASVPRFEGTILSTRRLLLNNQASDRQEIGLFALISVAWLGYTLVILRFRSSTKAASSESQRQRL